MPEIGLGIGVIGCGRAGMIHAANLGSGRIPGARLLAVSDPVPAVREQMRQHLPAAAIHSDHRTLLEVPGLAAVIIASPTDTHRDLVLAAAAAGRQVLCEKPLAMNVAECRAILTACRTQAIRLQLGFMRRFDADYLAAWTRVQAGAIGPVVQVRSHTHGPSVPQPWMYDLHRSNGPLAEVCSHDIDTLRWFTGSEITEVHALAGNYRCPQAKTIHPDFYDTVLMTARLANGCQGLVGGAQGVGYAYDARCEILGTEGLIQVGRLQEPAVWCADRQGLHAGTVISWRTLFTEAYRAELAAFVACIQADRAPQVTAQDGAMAVAVVEAGNRSIRERRPVAVEPVTA